MHPTKRAQPIAQSCPQALDGIAMHFPDPIAIIIARPLFFAMRHGVVLSRQAIVALPLIGVAGVHSGCGSPQWLW